MVSVISAFRIPKTCFAALSHPDDSTGSSSTMNWLTRWLLAAGGSKQSLAHAVMLAAYDAVVIRSTYGTRIPMHSLLLAEIEHAGTPLFNALDLSAGTFARLTCAT